MDLQISPQKSSYAVFDVVVHVLATPAHMLSSTLPFLLILPYPSIGRTIAVPVSLLAFFHAPTPTPSMKRNAAGEERTAAA
jgi:hypothetical protein